MTAHFVYEFYDSHNNLLYVGCSGLIGHRFAQHEYMRPWWPEVVRIEANRYETAEAALSMEEALIRDFDPPHNTLHTTLESDARKRSSVSRKANTKRRHDLGLCVQRRCQHCLTERAA